MQESQNPSVDELIKGWINHPDRKIFLIDETRRDITDEKDQLTLFTCVCTKAYTVLQLLSQFKDAGLSNLYVKGKEIFNDNIKEYRSYRPIICDGLRNMKIIMMATTSKKIKSIRKDIRSRLRVSSNDGTKEYIEGPELGIIINLIKKAAMRLSFDDDQIDVVIDRSNQYGADPGKRKLDKDTFEIFGPGKFNRKLDRTISDIYCPSDFRLIFNSDQGCFRNLLLLPDSFGYFFLYKYGSIYKDLYKSFSVVPTKLIYLDQKTGSVMSLTK
jgi:hypothetical protein